MPTRQELVPVRRTTLGWAGPKDRQNKTHKFLSVFGIMYVIANSRKGKGRALKEHKLKVIVPRGFDAKIEEVQGQHRQAIIGRDNQIHTIQYQNVALQAKRDVYQTQLQKCQDTIIHLRTRYVDHVRDPGRADIIIIVRKHTKPANYKFNDLPYYVARIQRRKRY